MSQCISGLENIYAFVEVLQLIAEPNRIKILCLLWDVENDPERYYEPKTTHYQGLCVYDIMKVLDKPQALVSHHLWMLKRAQLVTTERVGKKIYYQLNHTVFDTFKEHIKTIFHFK